VYSPPSIEAHSPQYLEVYLHVYRVPSPLRKGERETDKENKRAYSPPNLQINSVSEPTVTAYSNLQPQHKAHLQVYLPSLLQGRVPLPRCQSHPESRHYSWVMIMALAPTHMHSTDIRPLITKYKHHGSQADNRALRTHAFTDPPDIDITNDNQEISKRRPTKRNRDQGTKAWHTHAPNGNTINDSPRERYGKRLFKNDIFTNTQRVRGRCTNTQQVRGRSSRRLQRMR